MRACTWIALLVIGAFGVMGCHTAKRVDRPVACEEFSLPPANDPRWLEPSAVPDKKTPLVPYQRPNASPQGAGQPSGMAGPMGFNR